MQQQHQWHEEVTPRSLAVQNAELREACLVAIQLACLSLIRLHAHTLDMKWLLGVWDLLPCFTAHTSHAQQCSMLFGLYESVSVGVHPVH
jgi:hypothetical protein